MRTYRMIVVLLILCLVPVGGYTQVYHYIDKDGVERYSNQPPPDGAKIIGKTQEVQYDKAAGDAQDERNREAAAAQPAPQPAFKPAPSSQDSPGETVVETGDGATGEKKYSRRKHRRKKQIRKEKAEMRRAMEAEALEQGRK